MQLDPLMPDPFLEDSAVCAMAERFGLELSRYETIEVEDESVLKAAGWMRQTPDYSKIRKALKDGAVVPGVKMGGVQYTLRKRQAVTS